MKINLYFVDEQLNKSLKKFILSNKKIKFTIQDFHKINSFKKEKNLIIFAKNSTTNYFNNVLKKIQNYDLKNFCFFLPFFLKKDLKNKKINICYYPLKILELESELLNLFYDKIYFFKDLNLLNDNNLIHIKYKKNVYLTEIESKIIKLLFTKKYVLKETISLKALNQKPSVESKSLESHLYRLRKKISSLDTKIQILPHNKKSIKIKYSVSQG